MKLKLYFFVFLVVTIGCSQEPKKAFYHLIDENFLQLIDTTAYKTGRLLQIPKDTGFVKKLETVCISVDCIISRSVDLNNNAVALIHDENLKEFEEMILKNKDLPIDTLDLSQIKSKGRYSLIQSGKQIDAACSIIAGNIKFYTPFLSSDKAILIFSVFDSPKSGYTQCWLFKKDKGHWQAINKLELERW
jgi:hypothetical protein